MVLSTNPPPPNPEPYPLSNPQLKPKVIIIGGGCAGLATGLRLGRGGLWSPVVLERDHEPGGLARSLHFKGVSTDLGPHRLHTELP